MFAGWNGAGCSGTGTCMVATDMARTVVATFYYDLNLGTTGNGSISSQTAGGLACAPASGFSQCIAYAPGAVVTVTQAAGTGYSFGGWSGSTCSGTAGCMPTMSAPVNVLASFSANLYPVSVSATSNNPGPNTITSIPPGIDCSGSCSASFAFNSQVTLRANPQPDTGRLAQWTTGPCAGSTDLQCTFIVPAGPVSAAAAFDWFATLQILVNRGLPPEATAGEAERSFRPERVARTIPSIGVPRADGGSWSVTTNVHISPDWNLGRTRIVAFAQDRATKRILGATTASLLPNTEGLKP
jgi:hypothetical protein